ncbi:MAG: Zn2+/Cd2+-exporting ATPase [Candidatus Parcubacteria bacterium]|jgi:heavy metal translocating P-type ATPase|nr:Zn2+/Cd2+-exporting ATPase [Candidatus Parcubacteria bacterium]
MKRPAATRTDLFVIFDIALVSASALTLIVFFFFHQWKVTPILAGLSFLGLIPVVLGAISSLKARRASVDLLASIALAFSLLQSEWSSAAFITLMLASARIFDHITESRAKRIIESLMKFNVEKVCLKTGDDVRPVHISQVKAGDLVIVESGDRLPVDGEVVSGEASVDESSLTGESELVPKKIGDRVFTATMNEAGSLVVKALKVGSDTTLARIMALVEEASRSKSRAERVADTFTQWYIGLTLAASIIMYAFGLAPSVILSVLLVVCADDVAIAVPLAFTAAIARMAKRGLVVKGSAAFEQLWRLKYVLSDKTGTLTRGQPKIVGVKTYCNFTAEAVLARAGLAASESHHAVARALAEYIKAKGIIAHAPRQFEEVSGQGVRFWQGNEVMLLGRLSFMEREGLEVPEIVKKDIGIEKDAGRGVTLLAIDKAIAALISYEDELRPHVREIIAETKTLGVREWHMLTGDNEHVAAAVAATVGIRHFHANMTPESKVEFVRKFEKSRRKGEIVGYIGDGVNDAASMALVDVSIAMGGIGSDAAIEAADVTIMKDRLRRLPEILRSARSIRRIIAQCFVIWAITNGIGLGLVAFGVLGPAGAAAYNFLTDFVPIGNALRAGKGLSAGKGISAGNKRVI